MKWNKSRCDKYAKAVEEIRHEKIKSDKNKIKYSVKEAVIKRAEKYNLSEDRLKRIML